ncbi:MAG TPA: hypothetical protein VMR54_14435 [Thermoanaerobaculia bacterium]|nr:hypothetical protein [Thermoanaerobaculia bacterium]
MASDVYPISVREIRFGMVISKTSFLAWIAAARSVAHWLRSRSKPR